MKLRSLKYGMWARIIEVRGESDCAVRLYALGLLPGRVIRRENTAPLGDPVAYEIEGQKISIRLAEADLVDVELEARAE